MEVKKYDYPLNVDNGERMSSLFIPSEKNGTAIMFLHGYNSNRSGYEQYARAVGKHLGAVALTLDIGGHGESSGEKSDLTINDHLFDIVTSFDLLSRMKGVDSSRVGVVGASYGGYLAVMLSTMRSVNRLLLRAPALYPDGLRDIPRKYWDTEEINNYRKNLITLDGSALSENNENLSAVRKYNGQINLVISEYDESIPDTVMTAYEIAYSGISKSIKSSIIRGAKHSLIPQDKEIFQKHVLNWASEM